MSKYAEFYALAQQSGQSKQYLISSFTNGRTDSLRALSHKEYNALCASLRKALKGNTNDYVPQDNPKGDNLRKAIIHLFHIMQYEDAALEAKTWAEKMGIGTGEKNIKKKFNHYTNQELMILLQKAQKAAADQKTAIRQGLKDA